MTKLASLALACLASIVLASCGGKGSPADYPQNFLVKTGDASATVSWTPEDGVDYWIFYAPAATVTTTNWVQLGGKVFTNAVSPQVITGLVNGTQYAFTINGRRSGGPGGGGAPSQAITPRLSGNEWAPSTSLGTGSLTGAAAGTLVAGYTGVVVGDGGVIYAATGSAAFTQQTNPAAPNDLKSVTFGTSGFVAVGANGTIITSADGFTWTARTSNTSAVLYAVQAVPSGYIAVGTGGTIVTSSDGQNWTTQTSGTTADLYAVIGGLSYFSAVGANGTMVTSTDGAAWTLTATGTAQNLRGVAIAALTTTNADGTITTTAAYVAVGDGGALTYSTDGTTWVLKPNLGTATLNAVRYGGQFVAVGVGGAIWTSLDGLAWTKQVSNTTADLNAVLRTLTGYTAVGAGGTVLTAS